MQDAYNGLFQPLLVQKRPWVNLTIYSVISLSKIQWFNIILIVVDQFSKEKHYKPCTTCNNGTNTETTACLFLCHVWYFYCLSINLISDRGPQFALKIWDFLCKLLRIRAKLLTTWHFKTDGQSKIANQEMKQYLCSYIDYFQDDWVEYLPMAKFSSNVNTSATTKVLPFLVLYGYISCMSFKPINLTALSICKRLVNAKTESIVICMQEVWGFTYTKIAKSQQAQVKAANKYQKPNLQYKVGNQV